MYSQSYSFAVKVLAMNETMQQKSVGYFRHIESYGLGLMQYIKNFSCCHLHSYGMRRPGAKLETWYRCSENRYENLTGQELRGIILVTSAPSARWICFQ